MAVTTFPQYILRYFTASQMLVHKRKTGFWWCIFWHRTSLDPLYPSLPTLLHVNPDILTSGSKMTCESCLSEFLFNISCYLRMSLMVRIDLGVSMGPELRRTSLVAQMVKNSPANAGDLGLICGSRRCPGEGSDNPL